MAEEKKKPETTKAPETKRQGRKLGGDEAPTATWDGYDMFAGRLVSLTKAKTRYGERTRLVVEIDEPRKAEAGEGEIVTVAKGGQLGLWMTDRWHTSLSSELNKRIAIYREVDGTKVRYDVRGLD